MIISKLKPPKAMFVEPLWTPIQTLSFSSCHCMKTKATLASKSTCNVTSPEEMGPMTQIGENGGQSSNVSKKKVYITHLFAGNLNDQWHGRIGFVYNKLTSGHLFWHMCFSHSSNIPCCIYRNWLRLSSWSSLIGYGISWIYNIRSDKMRALDTR